ncbi:hypothetical protein C0J27_05565 [Candidatus Chromulinivorax destructor]|uniref:Uncharacterized protein n=2 Tax=Candidatus Chromulinivorax destructor TaxID=2066483 RepID=A0A345ZD02_9BACT|nr:hypothetical protein C0J27_05565 [Candidatus Chromulinivorax destructor]
MSQGIAQASLDTLSGQLANHFIGITRSYAIKNTECSLENTSVESKDYYSLKALNSPESAEFKSSYEKLKIQSYYNNATRYAQSLEKERNGIKSIASKPLIFVCLPALLFFRLPQNKLEQQYKEAMESNKDITSNDQIVELYQRNPKLYHSYIDTCHKATIEFNNEYNACSNRIHATILFGVVAACAYPFLK